jgi:hypothetical protein
LDDGKRYTIHGVDKLTLKLNELKQWCVVEGAKAQFSWHLNRQSANNVRARYKEFATYFKGVVSLRTEEFKPRYAYKDTVYKGVCVSLHELQTAFESDKTDPSFILGDLENIHSQRVRAHGSGTDEFFALIKSDQAEETKHTNFYKGALAVMMTCERMYPQGQDDNTYVLKAKSMVKVCDTIILKMHAKEVLMRKELPLGSVSKGTYDGWVYED